MTKNQPLPGGFFLPLALWQSSHIANYPAVVELVWP
jgi:hypothetical protein